jgi:hypothetical protein
MQDVLIAIRDHYLNGTTLTPKHEEMRQRLSAAFSLLTNYHSVQQAIPLLKDKYQYSEASAYRDINNALKLFGNVLESNKEGIRQIVYEYAIKTYQLAAKNGDYKAMAQAIDKMIKVQGLDRDTADLPDFEKLQPSIVVAVLPEAMENKLDKFLSKGSINLNDYVEDIEHEEILNTEGGATPERANRQTSQEE